MASKLFGVVAEFGSPRALLNAAQTTKNAGYKKFDTYSPFPIHGMDKAMGLKDSKLGIIVFCCAILGCTLGFGLQSWTAVEIYPFVVSGKPLLSWPAFVPITFEITILLSAFGAVFGMLALNRLPMLYHPLFKSRHFKKFSCDGFFLAIEPESKDFDLKKAKDFLSQCGGSNVEVIEDEK